VRSCILFQLVSFSGGEALVSAQKLNGETMWWRGPFEATATASATERDADVVNESIAIPAGESMIDPS
jgi:hypothetical protein